MLYYAAECYSYGKGNILFLTHCCQAEFLFLMIALEFDCICRKSCMRLIGVNIILSSWMLLVLRSKYTILDTLFSVRILSLNILVEFEPISSKSCMRLFRVNVIFFRWMLLMLERKYAILDTLFSIRILFLMIAGEFDCICSKSSM